ncbi:uncharacterized protein LOC126780417 [Nymphalis io]|uniref:uncharacterized protein LOC126780417 n=1 Tax=Inachis io TaxID=171585 RepID=UPI0021670FA9|nr:uncharacterized protein LOC126780417 [Nymphalis io]
MFNNEQYRYHKVCEAMKNSEQELNDILSLNIACKDDMAGLHDCTNKIKLELTMGAPDKPEKTNDKEGGPIKTPNIRIQTNITGQRPHRVYARKVHDGSKCRHKYFCKICNKDEVNDKDPSEDYAFAKRMAQKKIGAIDTRLEHHKIDRKRMELMYKSKNIQSYERKIPKNKGSSATRRDKSAMF